MERPELRFQILYPSCSEEVRSSPPPSCSERSEESPPFIRKNVIPPYHGRQGAGGDPYGGTLFGIDVAESGEEATTALEPLDRALETIMENYDGETHAVYVVSPYKSEHRMEWGGTAREGWE